MDRRTGKNELLLLIYLHKLHDFENIKLIYVSYMTADICVLMFKNPLNQVLVLGDLHQTELLLYYESQSFCTTIVTTLHRLYESQADQTFLSVLE